MRGESFLSLSVNTFPTTGFEYLSSLFIQRARTETFALSSVSCDRSFDFLRRRRRPRTPTRRRTRTRISGRRRNRTRVAFAARFSEVGCGSRRCARRRLRFRFGRRRRGGTRRERKRRNRAKKGPSRLLIISAVFRCSYKKNVSIYASARGYLCVVNLFSLLV